MKPLCAQRRQSRPLHDLGDAEPNLKLPKYNKDIKHVMLFDIFVMDFSKYSQISFP